MKITYVYAPKSYGLTPYSMMLKGLIRVRFDSEADLLCAALVLSIERIPIWAICGLITRHRIFTETESFATKEAVETALKIKVPITEMFERGASFLYWECTIPWNIIFWNRIKYFEHPFTDFEYLREPYEGEFIICDTMND